MSPTISPSPTPTTMSPFSFLIQFTTIEPLMPKPTPTDGLWGYRFGTTTPTPSPVFTPNPTPLFLMPRATPDLFQTPIPNGGGSHGNGGNGGGLSY
jgi:hypothetical protein